MLPNKAEYQGIKQVFTFSLQQYFKQKATFVMLLIMLLCSVGSVFIMSASMKRGQNANRDGEVLYNHPVKNREKSMPRLRARVDLPAPRNPTKKMWSQPSWIT